MNIDLFTEKLAAGRIQLFNCIAIGSNIYPYKVIMKRAKKNENIVVLHNEITNDYLELSTNIYEGIEYIEI